MRVGTKLTLVTVAGVLLVLGVHGYLRIEREVALFRTDMERDHLTLAHGLSVAAQTLAERSSVDAALRLLEDADEREQRIQIAWSLLRAGSATAAQQPTTHVEGGEGSGDASLVTRVPLRLRDDHGVLELRESLAQERSYIRTTLRRVATVALEVGLLCVVVIVGAGFLFVGRPMRKLLAKVQRIGRGDLDHPLELHGGDEISELAREINAMCDQLGLARQTAERETEARLAAVEQMRHADRLSIVGRLASGVAHELGTPLGVVLAHAQMIARGEVRGNDVAASADAIVEQTERMTKIIRQLLDLARRQTPERKPEDVVVLMRATLAMLEPVAGSGRVTLRLDDPEEPVFAEVDGAQIQQVFANLVMNAIQAQPHGGEVRIRVCARALSSSEIQVVVEDDGCGIPSEARDRVFEPFFTTKEPGEGTGLGLTVSYGIVRDHGGRLELRSDAGKGATFTVHLPAAHPDEPVWSRS